MLALLSLAHLLSTATPLVCTSLRGDTPWYLLLKPPHSKDIYYADKAAPYLKPYPVYIDSSTSPVSMTMRDVYYPGKNGSEPVNYVMFNDAVPEGSTSFDHGHTKGTVIFDDSTIVYLIHSVPHYTYNQTANYHYPHTGIYYGQHVFCITLPISYLGKLAYQIRMMWPYVYDYKIAEGQLVEYPDLRAIVKNIPPESSPTSSVAPLSLIDGTNILSFSKSGAFGADIYDALIAPHYSPALSLYTETWQHGRSKLHSNCTTAGYFVKNIVYLKFFSGHLDYKETDDHSKWAICGDGSRPVVCFGGVNRMRSQFKRGGGVFCFENESLYRFIYAGVGMVEECV